MVEEEANMNRHLKVALIHLDVRYRNPEVNRRELLRLNREAALEGAEIILNTELPTTGYSFSSRDDIAPYLEPETGATVTELAGIARDYGKYIGIGLAERDEATGIYYNSAVVIGPDGGKLLRYRKINAEARWACPGNAHQENTCNTPWGRVGVLVCSDTYHGLLPRATALRGADLLWVPANWPPGGVDPHELWRARVLENGFYLLGCNRTGKDRIMNCRDAVSCVFAPDGKELVAAAAEESTVFYADLPLDEKGRVQGSLRRRRLAGRTPSWYRPIYLDLRLADDLTAHHELPAPGPLHVHCVAGGDRPLDPRALEELISNHLDAGYNLFVLPPLPAGIIDETTLRTLARQYGVALSTTLRGTAGEKTLTLTTPEVQEQSVAGPPGGSDGAMPFPIVSYGTARVAMVTLEAFRHPELAVALAKLGCDLAVLSEETLDRDQRLLCSVKTVEGVAVAACASREAVIAMVPAGHEHWEERAIEGPGRCSYELDTQRTRRKRFQDRVNFELLLKNRGGSFSHGSKPV